MEDVNEGSLYNISSIQIFIFSLSSGKNNGMTGFFYGMPNTTPGILLFKLLIYNNKLWLSLLLLLFCFAKPIITIGCI